MNLLNRFFQSQKEKFFDRKLPPEPSHDFWSKFRNTYGGIKMFTHFEARVIEDPVLKIFESTIFLFKKKKELDDEINGVPDKNQMQEKKKEAAWPTTQNNNSNTELHLPGQKTIQTDAGFDETSIHNQDANFRFAKRNSELSKEKKEKYEQKSTIVHSAQNNIRTRESFFQKIKRGNRDDIHSLGVWLMEDKGDFIRDSNDPDRLCNRVSHDGKTPLFVACENGNQKVVEILLKHKADPYLLSEVFFENFFYKKIDKSYYYYYRKYITGDCTMEAFVFITIFG